MPSPSGSRHQFSPSARTALAAHVAVILLVGAYVVLCLVVEGRGGDANIGLGLGLLGLGALGLPWTQPALANNSLSADSWLYVAASIGGLALNLALHATAWWLSARRRT